MSETHGQSSSTSQSQEQQQHCRVKVDDDGNVMELRSRPRQVYYNESWSRKNPIIPNQNNKKIIIEKSSFVVDVR